MSLSALVNCSRQGDVLTDNGCVTNSTSLNGVVDLFFIAGASRKMPVADIEKMLQSSWVEDKLLTLKLIFWAGNVRGGAGERRFFRIALSWLEKHYPESLKNNLHLVPHFTRWDNLFHLNFDDVAPLVQKGLENKDGLLGKWMPRKKQYNNFAHRFRRKYGLNHKEYRQTIVKLSNTVEQQMCAGQWDKIAYKGVPSCAMNKYRTAFYKHDLARFTQFIEDVTSGKTTVHAGTLFPYQLYQAWKKGENPKAIEAQWEALPNYGGDFKILPICDVSGSMSGLPMDISVSLGLYLSERNTSIFHNAFITFSGNPTMNYLKGSACERMRQLEHAEWGMNTNLDKAFELILGKAIQNRLTQEDMPDMLLIISDMEFDQCGSLSAHDNIKHKYAAAGYKCPKLVFWNVNGRKGNVPVAHKTQDVALVSGATPAVIQGVLSGKKITPEDVMKETLNNKVYDVLSV